MAQLSAKLRSVWTSDGTGLAFWCPGCDGAHVIAVDGPKAWGWDGNVDRPTFTPSIVIRTDNPLAGRRPKVCHSYVCNGIIQFLDDCTHTLRGKSVPLPDFPGNK